MTDNTNVFNHQPNNSTQELFSRNSLYKTTKIVIIDHQNSKVFKKKPKCHQMTPVAKQAHSLKRRDAR